MSPDKNHSHLRVETSRPNLAENVVSACREKVRGMRGISAAALLAVVAAMGCQPAHHVKKCKTAAACAKDETPAGTTIIDITTPGDTTKPTDPTCPPTCKEIPDTTPPAKPMPAHTGIQVVGPSTPSVLDTGTVDGTDTNKVQYSTDNGTTWNDVTTYVAKSNTFTDSVNANETRVWRAVDKAGNVSIKSDSFEVIQDTLAPVDPIIANPNIMILGPNDPTMTTILGTLPQASETHDVEYRITDKIGTVGNWTAIPTYAPGDTTFYTSVPTTDSTVEVHDKDIWGNTSGANSVHLQFDYIPPIGGELPVTSFTLPATQTTFNMPGTYSTDTKFVKVFGPDGTLRGSQTIPDAGPFTFDLPVTTNTGETGNFTVQVIDARGNAKILGTETIERKILAPPSGLAIDCSGGYAPGYCLAGGFSYPVSFSTNPNQVTSWSASVSKISGTGTVGTLPIASGPVTSSTITFDYLTGSDTYDVNEITVTLYGNAVTSSASINVSLN